jgi:1-acyl-sn-glycerol-3-phosphate acyltransferase
MKFFRVIFTFYALIIFIALMLVVFPLALLAMFWGRLKGGNMIYRLCMIWGDIWFALTFIYVKKIYKGSNQNDKPYIYVANHISYLDTPVIVKAIRHPLRPLGKVEMSKVPVFGYIYKNAIVTVDRSSPENRARSLSLLKAYLKKKISILVFPEGTFNETKLPLKFFFNGAFRIAIETKTPIKPVLFLDTFDRMSYANLFSLNPGRCRIVYLPEVSVDHLNNEDIDILKQQVYDLMQQKLIEYESSWIG